MITCQKCGRLNEDHYRFCLGCGGKLAHQKVEDKTQNQPVPEPPSTRGVASANPARPLAESKQASSGTVPAASQAAVGALHKPSPGEPTAERPVQNHIPCPVCEYDVPKGDLYCGRCGARMDNTVLKQAELILIRADGSEGRRYPLELGENLVGRDDDAFSRDAWISPRHARFTVQEDKVVVEDMNSLNGVFVRIPGSIKLLDGAHLRIGLELLSYRDMQHIEREAQGDARGLGSVPLGEEEAWGRLARIIGPGEEADAWLLQEPEIAIGRDRGDIVFPQDAFVSGSHARLRRSKDGCVLEDLGSSNGTYLKIPGRWELKDSDVLLLGQQIVRLSMR